MTQLQEGQCGLCVHFGEHHPDAPQLVQIHQEMQAPEDYTDECGHPKHADLNLQVTPISGCDGFEPVPTLPTR